MNRVLVIAITRLGDLLQTEPALRALKGAHSDTHVTVLTERSFADVAMRLEGADHIEALDFNKVLATLDRTQKRLPFAEYADVLKLVESERFDEVWNLTHTRPSMALAALASPTRSFGVTLDRAGHQIVRNEWLMYFFATNLARPWCAHNLVDIYVNAVNPSVSFSERLPRLKGCGQNARRAPRNFEDLHVIVHPGASQPDKQWPTDRFAKLVEWLVEQGARVTLIGGKKEQILSSRFQRSRRVACRIGQTSFDDLIALCEEGSLLISGDSGPVHVAAACRLPVIAIEGGSAHGHETAPYGVGSYVIQPHLANVLRRTSDKLTVSGEPREIGQETVREAVECFLGKKVSSKTAANISIYQTAAERDFPGLNLEKRNDSEFEYDSVIDQLKVFWRNALSTGRTNVRRGAGNEMSVLLEECETAALHISMESRPNLLRAAAEHLTEAERNLGRLLTRSPWLHHFEAFLRIARSSLDSGEPAAQARELATVYARLADASESLDAQFVERSLETRRKDIEVVS